MVFLAAVITLGLIFAFAAGVGTTWVLMRDRPPAPVAQNIDNQQPGDDFDLLWEAWDLLKNHFYGTLPDSQHVVWGAIRGVVASLNDPHTSFIEPAPRQREKEALSGRFGGIGALVSKTEDGRIVVEPMPDLPAARAGVRKGDTLLKVDNTEITADMSSDDAVALIRGEIGTMVRLTLRHTGETGTYTVDLKREEIPTPTVEWRMLDQSENTGYIRITLFSGRTDSELEAALKDLKDQGMTQLVLDLRGNGGGLLDAGIKVASEFVSGGVILYQVEKGGKERTYNADGGGLFSDNRLAILVDGGTASASEIVAGSLQDRGRAVLVGDKTYGKGSVQQVFDLSDGSSLHITYADWLTPDRRQITGVGLSPELQVGITEEDLAQGRDPQLERAVQYATTGE